MQKDDNVILLAPDLIDTFPDSDSVNEALRSLKAIATRTVRRAEPFTAPPPPFP